MDTPFFNRAAELKFLHKKFSSRQPELLIFRGRRRVGKTFLLKEFSRQVNGLYLTEIDVFGYTEAGNTLIGEIKWTQSPVDEEVVQALEKKIAHVHPLTRGKIQKLIISKSGFVKGLARKHADLTLIDLGKYKV